ncbi:MAG TPA: chemotaxis response regulator protein-glutamate methylesterase [Polyangia bacterium]|jgi:two-component system chemotaxis response regulator CheB|nr:chemotaxis response regulator protein-glutamate methylesterase [Polyangia bacterium]
MGKIRVLVVDDSVVVRRLLSDGIARDPALEVVGTASHGGIALKKLPALNPDVVTMDIEMPEMDGLTALAEIRKTDRKLPVVMVSSLTERGAVATLDALALGATDYVTKPSAVAGAAGQEAMLAELIAKLKAFGGRHLGTGNRFATPARAARPSSLASGGARRRIDVVAIGISTGGPNALAAMIPQIPAGFPVPIVIVQHMPPLFTKLLADRLAARAVIAVKEGAAGDRLQPGTAYIAPGNHHMLVRRVGPSATIVLEQGPPENSCRPAADVLFRSVADVYGAGVLAVVMTGMGQDGLAGSGIIRDRGGQVLVQDEESSVVWGMPGFVVEAGLADEVLSLEALAPAIVRRAAFGRASPPAALGGVGGRG